MNGMGGMGGGEAGGHMQRCPLCGGAGVVTPEQAAQIAPLPEPAGGGDPTAALVSAMMAKRGGRRMGGGGHGGM